MTLLSFIAVLVGAAGAAGAYLKWFATPFSFYLCLSALLVIALNLPVSLVKFIRKGRRGTSIIALFFGAAAAGALGLLLKAAIEHPLTDVTNQPSHAPEFRHPATSIPAPGMEEFLDDSFRIDRSYDPAFAEKQSRAYPNIRDIFVGTDGQFVLPILQNIAQRHPEWRIVVFDEERGIIEIEDTHPVFNTVEDFIIEVIPNPHGSLLRMRSRSRFGFTDFGSNARRISAFAEELIATGKSMTPPLLVELR